MVTRLLRRIVTRIVLNVFLCILLRAIRIQIIVEFHHVIVDLRFLSLEIFLISLEHVVCAMPHALHLVLLRDIERGHDGGVVMAQSVE